jgi:hypothetical protein
MIKRDYFTFLYVFVAFFLLGESNRIEAGYEFSITLHPDQLETCFGFAIPPSQTSHNKILVGIKANMRLRGQVSQVTIKPCIQPIFEKDRPLQENIRTALCARVLQQMSTHVKNVTLPDKKKVLDKKLQFTRQSIKRCEYYLSLNTIDPETKKNIMELTLPHLYKTQENIQKQLRTLV